MFKKFATLATAAAMLATPAIAQSNPAQALSVSAPMTARAGAKLDDESNIIWSAGTILIGLVVVGLVVYGIVELTDDNNNDDNPVSG